MKYNFSFSGFFVNATSSHIKIIQNVISSVTHVCTQDYKSCVFCSVYMSASLCCFTITLVRDLFCHFVNMRLAVLFNIYIYIHTVFINSLKSLLHLSLLYIFLCFYFNFSLLFYVLLSFLLIFSCFYFFKYKF